MSNLCPKCLKDDQVQKVSALAVSGKYLDRPDEEEWKQWQNKGVSWPELDKEYRGLYPEPDGREARNYGLQEGCSLFGLIGSIVGFLIILAVGIGFSSNGKTGAIMWGCVIGFVYLFISLVSTMVVAKIIYEVSNPKEYKQKVTGWKIAKDAYISSHRLDRSIYTDMIRTQASLNFNKLYFCNRDDLVFLPGNDFCVESKGMRNISNWVNLGRLN